MLGVGEGKRRDLEAILQLGWNAQESAAVMLLFTRYLQCNAMLLLHTSITRSLPLHFVPWS